MDKRDMVRECTRMVNMANMNMKESIIKGNSTKATSMREIALISCPLATTRDNNSNPRRGRRCRQPSRPFPPASKASLQRKAMVNLPMMPIPVGLQEMLEMGLPLTKKAVAVNVEAVTAVAAVTPVAAVAAVIVVAAA